MQFTKVNETARLEQLNESRRAFRFEYSNRFYGSCSFTANLRKNPSHLVLDHNSLSPENFKIKRGDRSTLLNLAILFLNGVLLKYRLPEDLDSDLPIATVAIKHQDETPAEMD
jgi:hypothetical protein